jgi:hypothetical protein
MHRFFSTCYLIQNDLSQAMTYGHHLQQEGLMGYRIVKVGPIA